MRNEWRRMISGRNFWIAVTLCTAALVAGTSFPKTEELLLPGQFLTLVCGAFGSKAFCYLLPAAAVLPWSDSFLEEWRGGFLKLLLLRTDRRDYVEKKVFAVASGGAAVCLLASGIVVFGYFLLFFPREAKGVPQMDVVLTLAGTLFRSAMIAAALSSFGGICAVLSGSGYLAFGFPLVGYYVCMILQERYFSDALWLYPPQWISGAAQWGAQNAGLWMFLMLLLAGSMGIHAAVLYGKLDEI